MGVIFKLRRWWILRKARIYLCRLSDGALAEVERAVAAKPQK